MTGPPSAAAPRQANPIVGTVHAAATTHCAFMKASRMSAGRPVLSSILGGVRFGRTKLIVVALSVATVLLLIFLAREQVRRCFRGPSTFPNAALCGHLRACPRTSFTQECVLKLKPAEAGAAEAGAQGPPPARRCLDFAARSQLGAPGCMGYSGSRSMCRQQLTVLRCCAVQGTGSYPLSLTLGRTSARHLGALASS